MHFSKSFIGGALISFIEIAWTGQLSTQGLQGISWMHSRIATPFSSCFSEGMCKSLMYRIQVFSYSRMNGLLEFCYFLFCYPRFFSKRAGTKLFKFFVIMSQEVFLLRLSELDGSGK